MSKPQLFSDKENALKSVPTKRALNANTGPNNALGAKQPFNMNSENQANIRAKRPLGQSQTQGKRMPLRVPLGGKDQNSFMPGLARSQSTVSTTNDSKVQRPKVFLPRPPVLSKANSSLGFTHIKPEEVSQKVIEKPQPIEFKQASEKQILKHTNATHLGPQVADFTESTATDSLVKQDTHTILPEIPSFSSTITPRTQRLHSSNIQIHDANYNNVDPIKRSIKRRPSGDFVVNKVLKTSDSERMLRIERELIENDYALEFVPIEESPMPYVPEGMEPLTADDMEFFKKPHRTATSKEVPEFEHTDLGLNLKEIDLDNNLSFDFDEDTTHSQHLTMPKKNDSMEIDVDQPLGLTTEELHDLLD